MSNLNPLEVFSGMPNLTVDDMPNYSLSDRLVLKLVTDKAVDLEQLSGIAAANAGLIGLIIGLANSAYFSAPTNIHYVSDAVAKVLRLTMVRSVIFSVVFGRSLDGTRGAAFSVADY